MARALVRECTIMAGPSLAVLRTRRTRAASLGGTSNTSSPAANSCWDNG